MTSQISGPGPTAGTAQVEDLSNWQRIAQGLKENDDIGSPARLALLLAKEQEKNIPAIIACLKEMHDLTNYGGLSELLEELDKNPTGPIFEALKQFSNEIVASKESTYLGDEYITHLLAKAIQEQKKHAVTAISSSIPKIPHPSGWSTWDLSWPLMEACLLLVIFDADKKETAKQILSIFVQTTEEKLDRKLENHPFACWNVFSNNGTMACSAFFDAVIDLYLQLHVNTKFAGKE